MPKRIRLPSEWKERNPNRPRLEVYKGHSKIPGEGTVAMPKMKIRFKYPERKDGRSGSEGPAERKEDFERVQQALDGKTTMEVHGNKKGKSWHRAWAFLRGTGNKQGYVEQGKFAAAIKKLSRSRKLDADK